jgi:integral membrane protein
VRRVTRGSIIRYRFMAYFTGVMLLILCWTVYLKYGPAKNDGPVQIFGAIHGYGYLVYLIAAADLAWRARWPLFRKTVPVLIAGTIPFMSFVAERLATRGLEPGVTPKRGAPAPADAPNQG